MIAAAILATAFYGIDFNPASTNSPPTSRIYPVRQNVYRMVQPDGVVRTFELSEAEEGVLLGKRPWLGKIDGNRIDVWADPEHTGGKLRSAYTFVGGVLRLAVFDGHKYAFTKSPVPEHDLARCFPPREKRSYAKNSAADIWQGDSKRLRLWFANPNCAGILLAHLAILAFWGALRCGGKVGRCLSWGACCAVVYGLFATGSRGGLVALLVGIAFLLANRLRKLLSLRGALGVVVGCVIVVGAVLISGNGARITGTFRGGDASNMTRVKIARAAIEMFSDAPWGWRGGEPPGRNACLNWYVPDEAHTLRTHLMSMAERGWIKGFVYVFFWVFLTAVGAYGVRRGEPLPGACWASFAAAGMFNPVYVDWEIWVVPLLSTTCLARPQARPDFRTGKRLSAVSAVLSLMAVIALIALGKCFDRPTAIPLKSVGAATYVNGDRPRIWIAGDESVLGGGGFPGREILGHYVRHPESEAVAYVYDVHDLPKTAETLVLAGRSAGEYVRWYGSDADCCRADRIVMLSPSVGPDDVPEALLKQSDVVVLAGSLLAMHDPAFSRKRSWVKVLPGCERYIPGWMRKILQIGRK